MDTAQVLLVTVIVVLTGMLVVIGIQIYAILKEFKKTLTKANDVLDNANNLTKTVSAPFQSLSSFVSNMQSGKVVVNILKRILQDRKKS